MTNSELKADRKTMDAVCKQVENIGEAAGRIPLAVISKIPLVPWRKIKDMRNYLIHAYFGIDSDVVISVVREKLPELVSSRHPFRPISVAKKAIDPLPHTEQFPNSSRIIRKNLRGIEGTPWSS